MALLVWQKCNQEWLGNFLIVKNEITRQVLGQKLYTLFLLVLLVFFDSTCIVRLLRHAGRQPVCKNTFHS